MHFFHWFGCFVWCRCTVNCSFVLWVSYWAWDFCTKLWFHLCKSLKIDKLWWLAANNKARWKYPTQQMNHYKLELFFAETHKIPISVNALVKIYCLSQFRGFHLNNYFNFHVYLSIYSSVRPCLCPKTNLSFCSQITKFCW